MKKTYLSLIFVISSFFSYSQEEFSFKIWVVDSKGYSDTIILGYDPSGTWDIDTSFGEKDIKDTPYNDTLDFRVSNLRWTPFSEGNNLLFQTKKQIHAGYCPSFGGQYQAFYVDIKAVNWPVTFGWDYLKVKNYSCLSGGFGKTASNEGFYSFHEFQDTLSVNFEKDGFLHGTDVGGDSVISMEIYIADTPSTVNALLLEKAFYFSIYPNPADNSISIAKSTSSDSFARIYTSRGQLIKEINLFNEIEEIDLIGFSSGLYIVEIFGGEQRAHYQFIKN